MRPLLHGVMDYLMGMVLIAAPFVLGFDGVDNRAAVYVPVVLGAGAILYSLLTDYDLGVVGAIPMTGHLALDIGSGVLLVASPWLFGFAHEIFWPHLTLGLVEIGAGLFTQTVPTTAPHGHGHTPGMHVAH